MTFAADADRDCADILKRRKKNEKIAALLDFNANPTRQLLLQDLVTNRGILNQVLPEVRDLYHKLEVEFAPLTVRTRKHTRSHVN